MRAELNSAAGIHIDLPHAKIHSGYHYTGSASATLGANTSRCFAFRTGTAASEQNPHILFDLFTTGGYKVSLFEAPTMTTNTGETSFTLINNNRTSDKTTVCTYASVPRANVSAEGTRLDGALGGGSSGPGGSIQVGGQAGSANEIVCKSATTYLLECVNANGANTTDVMVNVHYYLEGAF